MREAPAHPAVVYDVVIDRFRRAAGEPDETAPATGDRCGGDLRGVATALDHLVSLGVDTVALSPIWPARSPLGDGVRDFTRVSADLGDDEALAVLLEGCRRRGLRLVLTGIFDRVSSEHEWFQAALAEPTGEGEVDPSVRTRPCFRFDDSATGYACMDGDPTTPLLDLDHHVLRHRLFHSDRSVVRQWLERGFDGWRIDGADRLASTVLREIERAAHTVAPRCLVVGDARGCADRDVRDGVLDGVVNHPLREALLGFVTGALPADELGRLVELQRARMGSRALNRCWLSLGAAGGPRLATLLGGDSERLHLAAVLQYLLPGAASIFYGDEVALGDHPRLGELAPMAWEAQRWPQELLAAYRRLGQLKRSRPALLDGDVAVVSPRGQPDLFAVARYTHRSHDTLVAVFNRGAEAIRTNLPLPIEGLYHGLPLVELASGERRTMRLGSLPVEVPPRRALVFAPDATARPHPNDLVVR